MAILSAHSQISRISMQALTRREQTPRIPAGISVLQRFLTISHLFLAHVHGISCGRVQTTRISTDSSLLEYFLFTSHLCLACIRGISRVGVHFSKTKSLCRHHTLLQHVVTISHLCTHWWNLLRKGALFKHQESLRTPYSCNMSRPSNI